MEYKDLGFKDPQVEAAWAFLCDYVGDYPDIEFVEAGQSIPGLVTITVRLTDANGCSWKRTVELDVNEDMTVEWPHGPLAL